MNAPTPPRPNGPAAAFAGERSADLTAARVAVLGCGSVGGLAAWGCAAAGVGTLVLADRDSTAESIEEALSNPPPGENKVRLDKKAIETYPQRFWGNIDDLRSKVLQSLNRKEEDFDKRLLRVQDIAYALKFFHGQIWRYQ